MKRQVCIKIRDVVHQAARDAAGISNRSFSNYIETLIIKELKLNVEAVDDREDDPVDIVARAANSASTLTDESFPREKHR